MELDVETRTEIYFKRDAEFERQQAILDGAPYKFYGQGGKKIDQRVWLGTERNRTLIKQFQNRLFAKGTKEVRIAKLTQELRRICDLLGKDLDQLSSADCEGLVATINRSKIWSECTKSDYRRAIKSFYLWFEDVDPRLSGTKEEISTAQKFYKYLEKEVKATYKKKSLDYSGIITDEEADLIITKGCSSPMERAMIAVLHEAGCRVGELLNMRIRDVQFKEKHGMLRLDGKTGERRTPIIKCRPWLQQWLADHPHKDNPNALLWVSRSSQSDGEPLRYTGVVRLITRSMSEVGIKKKMNPHHFRHSRATLLAAKYSEVVLCKMMGWTIGSQQVKTYVHLGAQQVEDAFLKNNGLLEPEREEQKVQFCVCGTTNTPTAKYCYKCGNALNIGTFIDDEDKKREAVDEAVVLLQKIMQNPDLMQKFSAFQQQTTTPR